MNIPVCALFLCAHPANLKWMELSSTNAIHICASVTAKQHLNQNLMTVDGLFAYVAGASQ